MSKNKTRYVSYSQYKKWEECPHRWYLDYALGLRSRLGNIYSVFGTAMHETLQAYLQVMYSASAKKADQLDLHEILEDKIFEELENEKEKCKKYNADFSETGITKEKILEFYQDGKEIIDWFIKKRADYFSKRDHELIGIEVPVDMELKEKYNVDVKLTSFLDVVTRNTKTNTYHIFDLKTSTKGWSKWRKKDKKTTDQLVLYKKFYADKYNVDPDDIEIEFLIMKRKVPEEPEWPAMAWRVQRFSPSHGSRSRKRIYERFGEFVKAGFTEDGQYNHDGEFPKNPGEYSCRFCDYNDKPHLCDKNGQFFGYMSQAEHLMLKSGEIEEDLSDYEKR